MDFYPLRRRKVFPPIFRKFIYYSQWGTTSNYRKRQRDKREENIIEFSICWIIISRFIAILMDYLFVRDCTHDENKPHYGKKTYEDKYEEIWWSEFDFK